MADEKKEEAAAKGGLKITETKKVSRKDILFSVEALPGTETVFVGSSDASVSRLDLSAEKPEGEVLSGSYRHSSYVTGLALAGKQLISGSYDRKLIWWDTETMQCVRQVEHAHGKWIRQVKVSPDGKLAASVADDMVCRLWNAETGEALGELNGHDARTPHHYPSMLFTCEFNADGSRLATADKVGHIVIWDVAAMKQVASVEAPGMYTWDPERRRHSIGGVRSLAFSPDGKMLAAGGIGQIGNIDHLGAKARVRLFDWEKGETLAEIETSEIKGLVERLQFHPEGRWLLGAGGDHKGFAILIDPAAGKTILEEKVPPFHVHDYVLNESADGFVAAGHNQVTVNAVGAA